MSGFETVGTFDLFNQIQGVGRFDQEIISAEFHAFDLLHDHNPHLVDVDLWGTMKTLLP